MAITSRLKWLKRKKRIRKKIKFTLNRPRLTVFRSNKHIYGQIVDDFTGRTLICASTLEKNVKDSSEIKDKVTLANLVGKVLAKRALKEGISKVVFDRNGFFYHGRVKSFSEGARIAGLNF